ncbi:hypothetical protein AB0F18_13230 [Streptomyces sp. NPDC029216]|uniref:hypothetical protein n=1 Tax=Streptomyces sp. NPDC029216 TaxID=3154701 RepID=UPI0033C012FB
MSRTAHHTPHRQTPFGIERHAEHASDRPWREYLRNLPWRRHTVHDLRYSAAEIALAEKEGRRPQPRQIRRSFEIFAYCCAFSDGITEDANLEERTARRRLRNELRLALHDADTDITPARHRYSAHWDSW